jgi:hypothetical protein
MSRFAQAVDGEYCRSPATIETALFSATFWAYIQCAGVSRLW